MAQQGRSGHHEDNGAEIASYIFNPMSYNYSQHQALSPPTVLSQQDATLMADFFNNPDTSNTGDAFASYGMDAKADFNNAHITHQNTFTSDPAVTGSHAQTSHANFTNHHMPQANRPPFTAYNYSPTFMQNNQQASSSSTSNNHHSAGDAVAGASALLGLSTSQEQANLLGANSYMTWPNIVGAHLQAPLTNSPTAAMSSARGTPAKANSTAQMQSQQRTDPAPTTSWAEIHAQEMQQRARHSSLQLDTTNNTHFATHQQSWQTDPMSAAPHAGRRPTMPKFGSDNYFSPHGFTGPAMLQQEEKQNSLMHMASAGDIAANVGSSQGQRVASMPNLAHRHSITAGMPVAPATQRSPVMVGGMGTPIQLMQGQFHPGFHAGHPAGSVTSRKRNFNQVDDSNVTHSTIALAAQVPDIGKNKQRRASSGQRVPSYDATTTDTQGRGSSTTPAASTSANTSRRRTTNRDARAPRQNLTDAQKRQNHIASEQKRRDTMKTNYEILSQRVPAVREGGALSRSEILFHLAAHMESMVAGNTVMCRLAGINLDQLDAMSDSEDDSDS